jgi:class 3 adenylate cyclase/pimeloyl-ACP methyl ester carboxylesterase
VSANAPSDVRYALSGDISIAYQVLGDGPQDVVMVPGFPSHLEVSWQQPRISHFYRRLASFSRLILLDKRGSGLSDRLAPGDVPGLEQRVDDLTVVLDAVGSDHASLVGFSDGGPLAAFFAASYPERTDALVLANTYPKRTASADYPYAPAEAEFAAIVDMIRTQWGQPIYLDILAPSMLEDEDFRHWWASFLRQSMSPGAALALQTMNAQTDVRAVLDAIHVPTLVVHRAGDRINSLEGGRYLADNIPGARFVELPGEDHFLWLGDADAAIDELEAFITGGRVEAEPDRALMTVLFTDIVGSTDQAAKLGDRRWSALVETHDDIVRRELGRFRGREVKTIGDGFLAVFDGPARAVRCAMAMVARLAAVDLHIRAGVHTAEIELVGDDVRGLGVNVAARIMALAEQDEVLVSSVVKDLSLGSGLEYIDHGSHRLKGVPGEWLLYEAGAARVHPPVDAHEAST